MGAKPCCSASPTSPDAAGADEPSKLLSAEEDQQSKDQPGPGIEAVVNEAKFIGPVPSHETKLTEEAAASIKPKLIEAVATSREPEATDVSKSGAELGAGTEAKAADLKEECEQNAKSEQKQEIDEKEEAARKLEDQKIIQEEQEQRKKQEEEEEVEARRLREEKGKKKAEAEAKAKKKEEEAETKKKAEAEAKKKKKEEEVEKKRKAAEEEKKQQEAKKLLAEAGVHLCAGAESGKTKLIKTLLAAGASPDEQDSKGRRPLQVAIVEKNTNVVKVLLEAKADPNLSGTGVQTGPTTPLLVAARDGSAEIASLLLEAGADPEVKNQRNQTAATVAEGKKNHEFIKVVRNWQAKGAKGTAK